MEPIFYVMAILGCSDGNVGCTQARVEPVRYATVQECQANLPQALARHTDLSFPVISAQCRRNGAEYAKVATVTPRG